MVLSITIMFLFIICKARRFRKQIRRIGGTRWSIDSDTAGQKTRSADTGASETGAMAVLTERFRCGAVTAFKRSAGKTRGRTDA